MIDKYVDNCFFKKISSLEELNNSNGFFSIDSFDNSIKVEKKSDELKNIYKYNKFELEEFRFYVKNLSCNYLYMTIQFDNIDTTDFKNKKNRNNLNSIILKPKQIYNMNYNIKNFIKKTVEPIEISIYYVIIEENFLLINNLKQNNLNNNNIFITKYIENLINHFKLKSYLNYNLCPTKNNLNSCKDNK